MRVKLIIAFLILGVSGLLHGEVVDEDYGSVSSMELNPQKARILLMLAMLKERSRENLQELFLNY